jgi:ATP-dependent Lhr-like helicase
VRPTRVAPLAVFLRDDGHWLLSAPPASPKESLSQAAREVLSVLEARGACFFTDLMRATEKSAGDVEDALWELVTAGMVTADGFENLRALLDPKRRRAARPRHAPGRWALMRHTAPAPENHAEAFARQLLARWGVVFRDAAVKEPLTPAWRDLLVALRRMESRGEIRGGRFLAAFLGEQFALPEALDLLRSIHRKGETASPPDGPGPWSILHAPAPPAALRSAS